MSVMTNAPVSTSACCNHCGRKTHMWKAWLRGNSVIGPGFWYYACAWHKRRLPGLTWSRLDDSNTHEAGS